MSEKMYTKRQVIGYLERAMSKPSLLSSYAHSDEAEMSNTAYNDAISWMNYKIKRINKDV